MNLAVPFVTAVVPVLLSGAATPAEQAQTAPIALLDRWVRAVQAHVPGRPDAAVEAVTSLTYDARRELNRVMPFFIAALGGGNAGTPRDPGGWRAVEMGRAAARTPGLAEFVRRAAVLHADAVVFAGNFPPPPPGPPPVSVTTESRYRRQVDRVPQPPALLWNEPTALARDGELLGEAVTTWHLPFARSLLNLLFERGVSSADTGFAGEWYHAVSAYLFAMRDFGDATSHLDAARRVLPNDARQVFDRATYTEALGLPIYQSVAGAGLASEGETNGDAEKLYRRTLEIDPAYVEARVRLARLLNHRGEHEAAGREIAHALESKPSGVVAFYAHLVAARVAAARGRYQDALEQYRNAVTLFGDAQSALLGASHAALMTADVPQALSPVGRLVHAGASPDVDPWRDYEIGAGRDVDAILKRLWALVRAGRE